MIASLILYNRLLNHIRKRSFRPAKVPNTGDQKQRHKTAGQQECRPPEGAFAAEQGPAEAVDDADHWVQCIQHPPFFRNDGTAEADGGHVKPELHDEWNDVTEVAVLDIE